MVAATSSQNWRVHAAKAASSAEPRATASPIWNEPLRPKRVCARATSGEASAPPTT